MHRRLLGVAPIGVLLIAAFLVAGCGSSSSSSTTTSTVATISKAEFVAKGNAICAAGSKTQEAAFTAFAKKNGLKENEQPTKAQQAEAVNTILLPDIQTQINAVKNIGAPSGEEQQVSSALETAEQELSKVKANPELAFGKESAFLGAGEKLHALGLTKCAANS
jgi:hypothetical protein